VTIYKNLVINMVDINMVFDRALWCGLIHVADPKACCCCCSRLRLVSIQFFIIFCAIILIQKAYGLYIKK